MSCNCNPPCVDDCTCEPKKLKDNGCDCQLIKSKDCDGLCKLILEKVDDHTESALMLDPCSRNFGKQLVEWFIVQGRNISCVLKNLKNQICSLWNKTDNLDKEDAYLQCQINKLKDILLGLVYNNVGTKGSYVVQQETPNLSVVVNNDGTFRYEWSDWNTATSPWTELGHGILTGKVNFTMSVNKNGGLDYHITGVYIGTVSYTTKNAGWSGSQPRYYILVPANGTQRWTRNGNVNASWSQNINATYPFEAKATIAPKTESAYINFMTWGADWEVDDKVLLRFKFINNNQVIDLNCPAPTFTDYTDKLC